MRGPFLRNDYATADHNGLHVFVKGRERRTFVVDNMFSGMANFSRRLERDGIEIRSKAMTPEQLEKSKEDMEPDILAYGSGDRAGVHNRLCNCLIPRGRSRGCRDVDRARDNGAIRLWYCPG